MNIVMLVIDPQFDFCNSNGSLYVPEAEIACDNIAWLIHKGKTKIQDIKCTKDEHQWVDISHPIWHIKDNGEHIEPFTQVTYDMYKNKEVHAFNPIFQKYTMDYLKALEDTGRFPHTIWTEHCITGSEGNTIMPQVLEAFHDWCNQFATVSYKAKGSCPFTEHFGALRAEVPYPSDPTTKTDMSFMNFLKQADVGILTGIAENFCLGTTIIDTINEFDDPQYAKKLIFATDCTRPVKFPDGSEQKQLDTLYKTMQNAGIRLMDSKQIAKELF